MTIGRTTGAARKDKMKSRRWSYSFNAQVSFAESRFASLTNQDTNLIESDELYINEDRRSRCGEAKVSHLSIQASDRESLNQIVCRVRSNTLQRRKESSGSIRPSGTLQT